MGRMQARQDASEERLRRIEEKLDTLIITMSVAKGGVRMLLSVAGIAAAISAGITQVLHHFKE